MVHSVHSGTYFSHANLVILGVKERKKKEIQSFDLITFVFQKFLRFLLQLIFIIVQLE